MANDGTLTCTQLQEIEVNLNDRWTDNAYAAERGSVKTGTIEAFLREQTAIFPEVENKTNKNNTVSVEWLEDCPVAVKACDVTCDVVAGVEFGDNCFTIDCNSCAQAVTISIDEAKLSNSSLSFDEVVGRAIYQADKAIAQQLNIAAENAMDAVTQVNLNLNTWGGAVTPSAAVGGDTSMSPSIWVDPTNYLVSTAAINNYTDPYYISGQISLKYALNATNGGEQTQSAANALINGGSVNVNGMRTYFDVPVLDTTLGAEKLFMLNRGEFAYINCYHYPDVANMRQIADGKFVYRLRSAILSAYAGRDIFHDVVYTTACVSEGNVLRKYHSWEILNRYALVQSPADCEAHNRVLSFTCV